MCWRLLGPGLDGGLAVVGLGEDVGDPDGDEPAVGEPLVEGVGREVAVEDLGELELDQEAQEQGDVIDTFVGQFEGGVHGGSPTRAWGKASLYRGSGPARKIQGKNREHGNYAQVGLRYNFSFSEHLIRERRATSRIRWGESMRRQVKSSASFIRAAIAGASTFVWISRRPRFRA